MTDPRYTQMMADLKKARKVGIDAKLDKLGTKLGKGMRTAGTKAKTGLLAEAKKQINKQEKELKKSFKGTKTTKSRYELGTGPV